MSKSSMLLDRALPDATETARLRQAELLTVVGRMAGGVAHDFNNLLATILGYAEFLDQQLSDRGDCSKERADLKEIRTAAERATAQTQRLLSFAQRRYTRPEFVDPRDMMRGIERPLERLAPPGVTLSVTTATAPGFVHVDRAQIERALVYLVVNGLDAMPSKGKLTIDVEWRDISARGLPEGTLIGATSPSTGVWADIRVADTGAGMHPEFVRTAFEPYVTSKTDGEIGSGLGLAAVYGLVAKAGGALVVASVRQQDVTSNASSAVGSDVGSDVTPGGTSPVAGEAADQLHRNNAGTADDGAAFHGTTIHVLLPKASATG